MTIRDLFYGMSEQEKAEKHRMEDARALFNLHRWRGAMYLAGYRIECLLKSKLMHMFDCRHLRELDEYLQERGMLCTEGTVFTHELEGLLRLTQGMDRLRNNEPMWRLFNLVNRWVPAWRYAADKPKQEDAEDFLEAIELLARWIDNNV